jgi:hypothetical protein
VNEVDLLVDQGTKLMPIEIKSGMTITEDSFSSLIKWQSVAGDVCNNPILIYGGKGDSHRRGIRILGWEELLKIDL